MTAHGKTTRILLAGGLVLFCVVVLYGMNMSGIQKELNLKHMNGDIGYFKEFSLQTPQGGSFTQENLQDYQITVVNGWAPWCPSCVGEMPDLQELYEELEPEGIQIVGVVPDYASRETGDGKYTGEINDTIKKLNITYPIIIGDQKFYDEVVPTMHNTFPGTWIVRNDGVILDFVSGAKDKNEWKEIIANALKQTGGEK